MTIKPNEEARCEAALAELAAEIGARAHTNKGDVTTPIDGLTFFRRDTPSAPSTCMVEPSIVLLAQGTKQMWIGGEAYPYGVDRFLLTSLDMPAQSEIVDASPAHPCLGLTMTLDLRVVTELIAQGSLPACGARPISVGVGTGAATSDILEPFVRLLALLDDPAAIPVLAPLIQREIHYRLLLSNQASRLRQLVSIDSQGHRISKAIDWLKLNYAEPFSVEQLAARVQMSTPTFHHHFRHLTAMSPLQYQKWLRLNEAKRLMLNEHLDIASAAFKVGYESPSQFSREYSRLFGAPPKRDIAALREVAPTLQGRRSARAS
jgi:AraC-like DNA-binding protein